MKYTLITFHFDRGVLALPHWSWLSTHINELDRLGACLTQGTYILAPEKFPEHRRVLEESDRLFRQRGIFFVALTFDLEQPYRWLVPDSLTAALERWDGPPEIPA